MDKTNKTLLLSEERAEFIKWFNFRYRKAVDKQRLLTFLAHLDKLCVLQEVDIYSVSLENIQKQYKISKKTLEEHLAPLGLSTSSPKNHSQHLFSLSNLCSYKYFKNRPQLFQDFNNHLNSTDMNLKIGSAFEYTSQAQLMAEKFSEVIFNKSFEAAIDEEPNFIKSLQQYIKDKKNKIKFKGSESFDKFLKINYDK